MCPESRYHQRRAAPRNSSKVKLVQTKEHKSVFERDSSRSAPHYRILRSIIIENNRPGEEWKLKGTITITHEMENYCGPVDKAPEKVSSVIARETMPWFDKNYWLFWKAISSVLKGRRRNWFLWLFSGGEDIKISLQSNGLLLRFSLPSISNKKKVLFTTIYYTSFSLRLDAVGTNDKTQWEIVISRNRYGFEKNTRFLLFAIP